MAARKNDKRAQDEQVPEAPELAEEVKPEDEGREETMTEEPSGSAAGPDALEEELARAQAETADWKDRYLRLHAEWDTYRRRTNEQRQQERARATENLVESLLPVLDDFERTIDYAEKNGTDQLLAGVQAVHNKLMDVLAKDGVELLAPVNEPFDALEAQAVGTVEDESIPDETVVEVYQKGYKMAGKVLRPAMVTVSVGGPKREVPEDEDKKPE